MIDEIFANKNSNEEFIVRTVFLYFFELMGIQDKDSLEYLCSFLAKNSESKKILSIFEDDIGISFDKLVFFSQEKKAIQ